MEVSFRGCNAVAAFKPVGATLGDMSSAAAFANTSLQGWPYALLAGRGSPDVMNCATLVWKA